MTLSKCTILLAAAALMPRRRPSLAISARVRVRKNASIAASHVARVAGSSVERL